MNTLNRNRLIGGGVLSLAALLFLPSILQPEEHALQTPDLAIHIDNDELLSQKSKKKPQDEEETMLAKQSETPSNIVLESANTIAMNDAAGQATSNIIPIRLESVADRTQEQPTAQIKKIKHRESISNRPSSWLQIDGFNNDRSALNAATMIEAQNLPTQIRVLSIDGKESRQVLVGPFTSSKKIQQAMLTLKKLGHKASIQR